MNFKALTWLVVLCTGLAFACFVIWRGIVIARFLYALDFFDTCVTVLLALVTVAAVVGSVLSYRAIKSYHNDI